MMSSVKLVILLSLAVQLFSASSFVAAFVSNGVQRTGAASCRQAATRTTNLHRLVDPTHIDSIRSARLQMSVIEAPPTVTPAKQKKQNVTISNDNQSDASKDRGWFVRLYNDPMNKREFVSRCLTEICGLGDGQAYSVMMKAHQTGIAVIGNYPRELAELYKVKLSGEGLLIDMVPADDD